MAVSAMLLVVDRVGDRLADLDVVEALLHVVDQQREVARAGGTASSSTRWTGFFLFSHIFQICGVNCWLTSIVPFSSFEVAVLVVLEDRVHDRQRRGLP